MIHDTDESFGERDVSREVNYILEYTFFISNFNFRVRPGVAKDFSKSRPKVTCKVVLKIFKLKKGEINIFKLENF